MCDTAIKLNVVQNELSPWKSTSPSKGFYELKVPSEGMYWNHILQGSHATPIYKVDNTNIPHECILLEYQGNKKY